MSGPIARLVGAAILGAVADHFGVECVFEFCAYAPLLGAVAFLLPAQARPTKGSTGALAATDTHPTLCVEIVN
jgi:FSR family fosmidomycin resistance protein-like MFS transporter